MADDNIHFPPFFVVLYSHPAEGIQTQTFVTRKEATRYVRTIENLPELRPIHVVRGNLVECWFKSSKDATVFMNERNHFDPR